MAGWDLKEGIITAKCLSDDKMWIIMNQFFSSKTKYTTTYKFALIKCLLDNLFNVDVEDEFFLSYDTIFSRFTEIYWNLVANNNLCQFNKTSRASLSAVEKVINESKVKYNIIENITFESLRSEIQLSIIMQVKRRCSTYVLGTFMNLV